jgi:hypothetical protein
VEMAIRILVEDGKSLHEITGDLIAEMTLVTRQYVNKVKSEIVEQMTTLGNKFQVPEVTKSELTVTAKLKDELASMQPVARKRTPRFKASFNVSRET